MQIKNNYKGRDLFDNVHPLATRELAIFEHNAKVVDQGALLKKKVTRPAAALLTWPKRFECSAFWGMMNLLEIDGKAAPGAKPLPGNSSPEAPPAAPAEGESEGAEESQPPVHNIEEVSEMAKQKSFRLRESIVLQAMSGPAPSGIKDPKDRGGLDALIFQAANRGKQRSAETEEFPAPPISPPPQRKSAVKRDSMLSPKDMSAIANLTEQLCKASIGTSTSLPMNGCDPLYHIRVQTIEYEKEATKAKLNLAEKEVLAAKAEHEAAQARIASSLTQVALLRKLLEAYENAETSMTGKK